jgi:hypothetical protein
MRQGPHQGAQKSTSTGTGEALTARAKPALSTAWGAPEVSSARLHLPQTGCLPAGRSAPRRFMAPHAAHRKVCFMAFASMAFVSM